MIRYALENKIIEDAEITHYWDDKEKGYIFSKGNYFWGSINNRKFNFKINLNLQKRILLSQRFIRRTMRFDKSNAIFNFNKDGIVIIYRGKLYFYYIRKNLLKEILNLKNCRNILHNGICVSEKGIFFGEYGGNKYRKEVPVYASYNDGRAWEIVYKFKENTIRHIHGIYFDKYSKSLFITTGDNIGECFLVKVSNNFSTLEFIGNGSQEYRCVNLFFKKDKLIWGMDSEIQPSYIQYWDRKTKKLERGIELAGPAWYSKEFKDGSGIIQTTSEVGAGVKDNFANLYFSEDLENWQFLKKYKKDIWPKKVFKYGVIGFAEGSQNRYNFPIHAEGLQEIDGKSLLSSIKEIIY